MAALLPGPGVYPGAAVYPASIPPDPIPIPIINPGPARALRTWTAFSRDTDFSVGVALPIQQIRAVVKHLGVGAAVFTTTYDPERWEALGPSRGLLLYRDGKLEFSGRVSARQADWDKDSGRATITVDAVSDTQRLKNRLVFPDPLRSADDQTVGDYWSFPGVASTAMRQLISDQAGPTCRPSRQVPGLVLGADPGVGIARTWTALFPTVLDQLAAMSVASGANLGLRITPGVGSLTVDIVTPRDLAAGIRFSADLGNLAGFTYREEQPQVTHALSAGQGDLHLRLRHLEQTGDPDALAWGDQFWSYIDRRDTADVAELTKAGADALAEGGPKVSLALTLADSEAATYGRDWGLGDRVTVYVGLPGQVKVATVSDVVREIAFEVDSSGAEKITPAVGTFDAKAVIPTPTQQQLARIGDSLSGLSARQ